MILKIIGGIDDSEYPVITVSKNIQCDDLDINNFYGIIMKKDDDCVGYSHDYFIDIYNELNDAVDRYKLYLEKEKGLYQLPDEEYTNQYRQLVKLKPIKIVNNRKTVVSDFIIKKAYYSNRDLK
jgi:hypothetical protein